MGDLDRVKFGGVTVDRRTRSMLVEAQRLANEKDPSIGKFKLCQGCWSHASASAGTHGGPGAFDMYTAGFSKEQKEIVGLAFREVGFASWRRKESQGPWQEHWHGIAMGTEGLPPLAASQVNSYLNGRNGLKGNARDTDERPEHIRDWEDYKKARGPLEDDKPDQERDTKADQPADEADKYDIDPGNQLDARRDTDSDGLTDQFERLAGTNATSKDSDNDGLSDGYEAVTSHTDPLSNDTDSDGQTDPHELASGSDPGRLPGMAGVVGVGAYAENVRYGVKDTDRDGLSDHVENLVGSDAKKADTDQDQLSDATEAALGTDPTRTDSDHDGVADGFEVQSRADPLSPPRDPSNLTAAVSRSPVSQAPVTRPPGDLARTPTVDPYRIESGTQLGVASRFPGTDSRGPDSDLDGLTDAFETWAGTDANKSDSDGDRLSDATEVALGTSPMLTDTDSDGILDSIEAQLRTDPLSPGSTFPNNLGGPSSPGAPQPAGQPGHDPGGLFD